ncbi:hypothetical protein JL720_14851 [Aureococcus anophagefferens]|nr:hypothetical protein JL720_14851 [Aureococcus anophagefferens]
MKMIYFASHGGSPLRWTAPMADAGMLGRGRAAAAPSWRRRVAAVAALSCAAALAFAARLRASAGPRPRRPSSRAARRRSTRTRPRLRWRRCPSTTGASPTARPRSRACSPPTASAARRRARGGPSAAARAAPAAAAAATLTAPHVVLFLIDDQGFNDIGAESTDLSWATPRLEALADGGVRLTRYYSMHLCTPARAALLTGRYPASTGMQHSMLSGNEPWGLPLNETIWPEYANERLAYEAVMVGKWHLGHYNARYLPTGFEDHFNHVSEVSFCGMDGAGCWFDLKNGTTPVTNRTGDYGLYILRDVASQKIRSRDPSKPLLLYFASPTVHMPMQTPPLAEDGWWTDKLKAIANIERRAFAAATVATDNVAGDVVDALRETNHWDDTVFVCASDNGAQPQRRRYGGLFHVTDWLPTLLYGSTGTVPPGAMFDGIDHWAKLEDCARRGFCDASPRSELLVNADDYSCLPNSTATECLKGETEYSTGAYINGSLKLLINAQWMPQWPVPSGQDAETVFSDWSAGDEHDMLFNVVEDRTESVNLISELPEVYRAMKARFTLNALAATPAYCGSSDNDNAVAVLDATHFLGPWTDDDNVNCADVDASIDVTGPAMDDDAFSATLDDVSAGDPDDAGGDAGGGDESGGAAALDELADEAKEVNATRLAQLARTRNITKLAKSKANAFPTAVYCRYGLLPASSCGGGDKKARVADVAAGSR